MHFKKPALENYLFFFPTEACFKNNKRAALFYRRICCENNAENAFFELNKRRPVC
jgi:hypothetical protein